jgi:hypothetical protein
LHLCGSATDNEFGAQAYTAMNVPARTKDEARAMFVAAKQVAECDKEAADFCCDLNLGWSRNALDHADDFWTNRQLVPQLLIAVQSVKEVK